MVNLSRHSVKLVRFEDLESASPAAGRSPAGGVLLPQKDLRYKITRQIQRRRGATIHAYVGSNGAGKSASAIRDTLPSLDNGRKVLSTVALYDSETGELHKNYEPLVDWTQVLDARHCDLLFDEVTGIASSRESMGMPIQVQVILDKLRKSDLVMRWTGPSWANADARIRRVTQAVSECRGYMKKYEPSDDPTVANLWPSRRLFRVRTFPTTDFDEFDKRVASQEKRGGGAKVIRAQTVEWWWGPGSRVFASYGTLEQVSRVGEVLDSGRCAHCGGRRTIPLCKCEH